MEATWDLQAPSPPKSVALFPATGNAHNPFDQNHHLALVFGTESGSLHYRVFPPIQNNSTSSPQRAAASSSKPIQALQDRSLPRELYPIDSSSSHVSFSGPIVQCTELQPSLLFLVLIDDSKTTETHNNNNNSGSLLQGTYAAHLVAIQHGSFQIMLSSQTLPRMSAAVFHSLSATILYTSGRTVYSIDLNNNNNNLASGEKHKSFAQLPGPSRSNGKVAVTAKGRVFVASVGSTFYALDESPQTVKLLSLSQSSQIHPTIILDIHDESIQRDEWNALFLANGRECAVVDLFWTGTSMLASKPRNGIVHFPSPILAAESSWPFLAVLTSDGLVSMRNPSSLAIPIRTIEIGTRPNDFFALMKYTEYLVAVGSSGEGKVFKCYPDTKQDLADRIIRYAIDALGASGFPRQEVAQAIGASFTAASYIGPEPTPSARLLLVQYLEAILELSEFESGASTGWPVAAESSSTLFPSEMGTGPASSSLVSENSSLLLTATALYCLVESQQSQTGSASRAAQLCAEKTSTLSKDAAAVKVCEIAADSLLRDALQAFSLLSTTKSPAPSKMNRPTSAGIDLIEASIWLLRACGRHEKAINIAFERLQGGLEGGRSHWSRIKYESYITSHFIELWRSGKEDMYKLVLESPAMIQLLERNPRLGLSVFTSDHPTDEISWQNSQANEDPLSKTELCIKVVKLLKSTKPTNTSDRHSGNWTEADSLPLTSGHALAISYLESAIGVTNGRTVVTGARGLENDEDVSNFHDELAYLLLHGVVSERSDDAETVDSELGKKYRSRLQRFLQWPLAKIRADKFLSDLPSSFQHEKALVLGHVGRHEDALRILYSDLDDLNLALQYCDVRNQNQKTTRKANLRSPERNESLDSFSLPEEDNAYLPLIRVALEADKEKGVASAIQVLALRRNAVDRAAALRLLPEHITVSSVARPFLIPALIDSESEKHNLTVMSALLRARYARLKEQLTSAQLKAQAQLSVVPELKALKLGDPIHSTSPFKARTSSASSGRMPEVMIVKHYFSRHLVIQAKVTNTSGGMKGGRSLSDISFVVAESSEDAIQPDLVVPIRTLPVQQTGSCWCVLSASPSRMDGPVGQLTCELRYTIDNSSVGGVGVGGDLGFVDDTAFGSPSRSAGRRYVEELQDLEVHASHFN